MEASGTLHVPLFPSGCTYCIGGCLDTVEDLLTPAIKRTPIPRSFAVRFIFLSCIAVSSFLKTEAIYSSEISFHSHWTVLRYIPEDRGLHMHRCENLTSHHCLVAGTKSVDDCLCHLGLEQGGKR
jgi:hypothetical protein